MSRNQTTLYICQYCHFFLFQAIPLYIHWINKQYIPQIDIHPIFKCDFCSFLAKITLKSNFYMFFACSLLYGCPRTFCDCLRTFLRTKHIFLRTFIASIMNGGVSLRTSNGCRSFQKIFQIHII